MTWPHSCVWLGSALRDFRIMPFVTLAQFPPCVETTSSIVFADGEVWQIHLFTTFTNADANQCEGFVPFTECNLPTLPCLPLLLTLQFVLAQCLPAAKR